jgi:Mrp family chromosome partitioning ATPase
MGLIEKAESALTAAPPAAHGAPAQAPSQFDIDLAALAAHGFYSPADRSSRLALELRAIKRRLLRRTGFRNAAGDARLQRKGGRQRNLVLVTSTRPGEGKTFVTINLALSLIFEEEVEVLLVDADIPRPKVRAHFRLPESRGLTDRLADQTVNVESLYRRARQAPLSILSEGAHKGRTNDLFGAPEAQRVFTELSMARAGRIVLIDAPPMLATAEAVMLARHVDEVVFVVEADATPQPAVEAALDELLDANPNVSLVLNRCLIGPGAAYYGAYGEYDRGGPTSAGGAETSRN